MKILTLSWEYPPRIVGGLGRHVDELTRAQIRAWDQIHVVTADHPDAPAYEQMEGVHVHREKTNALKNPDFLNSIEHLNQELYYIAKAVLQEGGFDLIHAHDWLVADCAVALKHEFNLPLIGTMHATERGRWGGIYNDTQSYINHKEWLLNYESAKSIVCTNYMKRELENYFDVPSDKIRVIPNGIETHKFINVDYSLDFRRNFALDNEKIIMTMGRMVPEKGFHNIVAAAPEVLYHYPDAKFVIVGGGPQKDSLVEHVRQLGLQDKIFFPGKIDDNALRQLLRVADAAVYASLYEPFGIVALEAMACHLPVVVSDAGGLPEVVEHGVTGITTFAGNSESIAWGLLSILTDPGKAAWMADNAYERLFSVFNWDLIMDQTRSVYNEVI